MQRIYPLLPIEIYISVHSRCFHSTIPVPEFKDYRMGNLLSRVGMASIPKSAVLSTSTPKSPFFHCSRFLGQPILVYSFLSPPIISKLGAVKVGGISFGRGGRGKAASPLMDLPHTPLSFSHSPAISPHLPLPPCRPPVLHQFIISPNNGAS